ncbi:MAG: endopeptidase La [Bacilli bacterium]
MTKSNLPVMLLKGLVLLPYQEVRIELNNDISKKVANISKLNHNSEVLVVTPINDLEESPDTSDLPKIGVIGRIKSRIDLENGNLRIVILGIKRVKVYSYVNYNEESDILESIITSFVNIEEDEIQNTALLRKLINVTDTYIAHNPFISNSISHQIKDIDNLDKLTDMIANFLPLNFEKKFNLMLDASYVSRAKSLIKEINVELAVLDLEQKIDFELNKGLEASQKEFILREKIDLIKKELGEKNSKETEIDDIKNKISLISIPEYIKKIIDSEVSRYETTPETSPETAVIRNYIDYLIKVPWNIETKDESDLNVIEQRLDSSHYGLNEVKKRIIEYIAVKQNSKTASSPIICLVGPPGVGKTTFAEAIGKSINRKFVKVSLGGLSDNAELIGHRRTYIGSNPGKIITSLIKAGSMNPVFLLDEVDKLSKDYRGDPASTLLEILDENQNKSFVDSYLDVNVDLSRIMFILTANSLDEIPPALYDRLEIIEISGYSLQEKTEIASSYLIPKVYESYNIKQKAIKFEDDAIRFIIDDYTREAGVRALNRIIYKISRKVITEYKKDRKLVNNVIINRDAVIKYLGNEKYYLPQIISKNSTGIVRGVAYSSMGGVTLDIEATTYPGKGNIKTTGKLGSVITESMEVAISYIKANATYFGLKPDVLTNSDLHIHIREGAVAKDGPSAGVTITTAILSHLKNKTIDSNISMTGEITLNGDILPIGGLKEKSLAAIKSNINTIYIPKYNKRDVLVLEDDIKNKIKYIYVDNYKEIYKDLFTKKKS